MFAPGPGAQLRQLCENHALGPVQHIARHCIGRGKCSHLQLGRTASLKCLLPSMLNRGLSSRFSVLQLLDKKAAQAVPVRNPTEARQTPAQIA